MKMNSLWKVVVESSESKIDITSDILLTKNKQTKGLLGKPAPKKMVILSGNEKSKGLKQQQLQLKSYI